MAYATIRSGGLFTDYTGESTAPTVTLPSTVESGDLLLVMCAYDNTASITWDQSSHGTWSELTQNGFDPCTAVYAKVADGTEDSGTLTLTTAGATQGTAYAMALTGWEGTLSGVTAQVANGSSANPDPPSVTATGGSGDNLFMVVIATDAGRTITGWPSGYTDNQTFQAGGGASGAGLGFATQNIAAATDDPATATISATDGWDAHTVVVEPSGFAITSVSTDDIVGPTEDPWVIAGSGFGDD